MARVQWGHWYAAQNQSKENQRCQFRPVHDGGTKPRAAGREHPPIVWQLDGKVDVAGCRGKIDIADCLTIRNFPLIPPDYVHAMLAWQNRNAQFSRFGAQRFGFSVD